MIVRIANKKVKADYELKEKQEKQKKYQELINNKEMKEPEKIQINQKKRSQEFSTNE